MAKKLDQNDSAQVKKALAILEPIAQKNDCEVADLLNYESGEEVAESDDEAGEDKVNLIVARMKAGSDKDYEG